MALVPLLLLVTACSPEPEINGFWSSEWGTTEDQIVAAYGKPDSALRPGPTFQDDIDRLYYEDEVVLGEKTTAYLSMADEEGLIAGGYSVECIDMTADARDCNKVFNRLREAIDSE